MAQRLPLLLLLLLPPLLLLLLLKSAPAAAAAAAAAADPARIDTVHVLFMNHLDVGFATGAGNGGRVGLAANVVDIYFNTYFPKALAVADELRRVGSDRLVYTTKAWLVSLYFDCPTGMGFRCPSDESRAAFDAAIRRGDIHWHGFPFNVQAELMDPALVRFALQLSADLDARFDAPRKITFSQRDVPGTTARLLPLLNDAGVRAVSFGVNGASAPADVPSVFRWRHLDPDTDDVLGEALAMYHPGGYGGLTADDCHIVGDWTEALCIYFKSDNDGPPDVEETQAAFATVRREFPNATVRASTFEQFVSGAFASGYVEQLPIVTGEIGDTWIHGIASDPLRLAQMRTILAERTACEDAGECQLEDPRYYNFSRLFLKAFEHTWGEDVKTALDAQGASPSPQYFMWSNEEFAANRDDERFRRLEVSWDEQRDWGINFPVQALADHPLGARLRTALPGILRAKAPSLDGFVLLDPRNPVTVGDARLSFDPSTGAIIGLDNVRTGRAYADATHPWGMPVYQSFDAAAFDTLLAQYMFCDYLNDCTWAYFDFGKVDLARAGPERRDWAPQLQEIWYRRDPDTPQGRVDLLVRARFPVEAATRYGAPSGDVWTAWTVPAQPFTERWSVSLSWFNKTSTRLPEALWLQFVPRRPSPAAETWRLIKLDGPIPASSVIGNGSYHLHAAERVLETSLPATFRSIDCPLVTLGPPNPFPTPLTPVDPDRGFAFNLYNNIWGTNYVMWYPYRAEDADAAYRFEFDLF